MLIYDAHCHYPALAEDSRQLRVAVAAVLPEAVASLAEYKKQNSFARIGIGLHPWNTNYRLKYANLAEFKAQFLKLIDRYHPDFIGETGLDKYKPDYAHQLELFKIQVQIADDQNLPLVIHCVAAYSDLLGVLTQFPRLRGLIHAYNGNSQIAQQLAKKNFYLGVGSVILKANSQLSKSIATIPNRQLILESDAPYMPPLAKASSTSNDCLIYAQRISQLKKQSLRNVIATSNAAWLALFS